MPDEKDEGTQLCVKITVPLIEKLLNPSFEYAGQQLKELIEWMVESVIKKRKQRALIDTFHCVPRSALFPLPLLQEEATSGSPVAFSMSIDPYTNFPQWDWVINKNRSSEFLDHLLPDNGRKVDRTYFMNLLCKSLSLSRSEKKKVLGKWPELSQFQVDALIETFEDEEKEFTRLLPNESQTIWELVFQSQLAWAQIVLDDQYLGASRFLTPALSGEYLFPYFALWPEYWAISGRAFMNILRDFKSASHAFHNACTLNQQSPYYWLSYGYCLGKTKNFKLASRCLEQAIKLSPSNYVIHLDKAEVLFLSGDFSTAHTELAKCDGNLPADYEWVKDTLAYVLECAENHCPPDIPRNVQEFISDIDSTSSWEWENLLHCARNSDQFVPQVRRPLVHLLQQLVAKQDSYA